jgi:hypothetical protein
MSVDSQTAAEVVKGGDRVERQLQRSSKNEIQEEIEQPVSRRESHISSDSNDARPDTEDDGPPRDLEATLSRVSTNSAPYSIFTLSQKRFIVFMVSIASFFSPLSANIYFPALNVLSVDFKVSEAIMNLTLSSYMIFQGLAPCLFGDLADMAGRRPAYLIGFAIYIGACVGLAVCDSFAALLVLRCLQSSGSSSTIALGSGVVADIATSAERGVWMGWATAGAMYVLNRAPSDVVLTLISRVAPAIAPVLGGILTDFLGWRW